MSSKDFLTGCLTSLDLSGAAMRREDGGLKFLDQDLVDEEVVVNLAVRFLYNRLALIMWYLLDIDLALFCLLLLWEVKLNKSWNTFFAIKVLFYVHDIIQSFATFQYQLH